MEGDREADDKYLCKIHIWNVIPERKHSFSTDQEERSMFQAEHFPAQVGLALSWIEPPTSHTIATIRLAHRPSSILPIVPPGPWQKSKPELHAVCGMMGLKLFHVTKRAPGQRWSRMEDLVDRLGHILETYLSLEQIPSPTLFPFVSCPKLNCEIFTNFFLVITCAVFKIKWTI